MTGSGCTHFHWASWVGRCLIAGLLSTFFDYTFRREETRRRTFARFRQIIPQSAMRDAVVEGFAIILRLEARVCATGLLDDIAITSWPCTWATSSSPARSTDIHTTKQSRR